MRLRSEAFLSGGEIPKRHTPAGGDTSPSFRWDGAPPQAIEYVLICDSPDAPGGPAIHWILYKIPGEDEGVPEGIPPQLKLEDPCGAVQGKNSFGTVGYRGPVPPARGEKAAFYRFSLFALKKELSLPAGADFAAIRKSLDSLIIDRAELVGVCNGM